MCALCAVVCCRQADVFPETEIIIIVCVFIVDGGRMKHKTKTFIWMPLLQ